MEEGQNKEETAILIVSFGTTHEETRRKTIEGIESHIRAAYPQYPVYRAWTSAVIRRKLLERDGLLIPGVREALLEMERNGIRKVVVQPTHVISGFENEQMLTELRSVRGLFEELRVGPPLLHTQEDCRRVIDIVARELPTGPEEALVLMGHGTEHFANTVYEMLDEQFKDMGYPYIFMGTVEAYPTFETVLQQLRKTGFRKVALSPFMIVAGDHAVNDLAGDTAESWKNRLEKEGFAVRSVLRGLGEYEGIRELFREHIRSAQRI